jgi:HEAT repeat protein
LVGVAGLPVVAPSVAPAASAQPAEPSDELLTAVEAFYHAAAVANYTAAAALGQGVLDLNAEPREVLAAFRAVHERRGPRARFSLDQRLLQWQNQSELEGVIGPVVEVINEGRRARATDPDFIQRQANELDSGRFAYQAAVNNLRSSGEFAVPTLLDILNDPDERARHGNVRRALVDLGLSAVNPLLAATRSSNEQLQAQVAIILGRIGYPAAIPYLLELQASNPGEQVQQATSRALSDLGVSGGTTAAQAYLNEAERFWRNASPIKPDSRFEMANLWDYESGRLVGTQVPAEVFDEAMAMRSAAKALELADDTGLRDEALALWLASNYRQELELESSGMASGDGPGATYFGTQAGVSSLQSVIDRATQERELPVDNRYDSAGVILKAVESMQSIIGQSTLDGGETPLTRAMNFPDRRVRIEAAMALAQALPTQAVSGGEQVVPLLADALSQTGEPTVLVVMPDRDRLNATVEALEAAGFRAMGRVNNNEAFDQAAVLPGVDVVVFDTRLGDAATRFFLTNAAGNPKLNGSAKLLLTEAQGGRFDEFMTEPTVMTSAVTEPEQVVEAVAGAREEVGGLPLDEMGATELATRAGTLLEQIGLGSSVFSLQSAETQLLAALEDQRPEVQKLAADVVALLEGQRAQRALLGKGLDDDAGTDARVASLQALATSAKRNGALLSEADRDRLLDLVETAESIDVRTAAAEAVGAMSLPVEQVKALIVGNN